MPLTRSRVLTPLWLGLAVVSCTASPTSPPRPTPGHVVAPPPARHGTIESIHLDSQQGDGTLDASRVATALDARRPALGACYDASLAHVPTLQGTLGVAIMVGEQRTTVVESYNGTNPSDVALSRCAIRRIAEVCAPMLTAHGQVTYYFTITFAPP